ncbi:hypothetical protein [Pseudacidovorax intermedius]|uniref:Uncharacterized protein n=1 Tax=Pseudacidovorax intermedius TaxID=433924 RepID=A0A147HCL4_9BURK|nr:hypothetical protein [Pseudacidovorax intermedius]KTT27895.1 hypothetical protein NS331_00605 [Pseudacidovorax intermedius]
MDAQRTNATQPSVMLEVHVPGGTPAEHALALKGAMGVFQATYVKPEFAWQAIQKLADWEQEGANDPAPLSEAEDLAVDVLLCAQEAANQVLGVHPGEPAVELRFVTVRPKAA